MIDQGYELVALNKTVMSTVWGSARQQCRISTVTAGISNPIRGKNRYTTAYFHGPVSSTIGIASLIRDTERERLVAVKSSGGLPSVSIQKRKEEHGESDCITATIEKPLGLVIAEDKSGEVVIESIEPGGNADRQGVFRVGDVLASCSAIVMAGGKNVGKKEGMYKGNRKGGCCSTGCSDCPFNAKNWVQIQFDCRGQKFDAVVAALSSNTNARWMRQYGMKKSITITVMRREKESKV